MVIRQRQVVGTAQSKPLPTGSVCRIRDCLERHKQRVLPLINDTVARVKVCNGEEILTVDIEPLNVLRAVGSNALIHLKAIGCAAPFVNDRINIGTSARLMIRDCQKGIAANAKPLPVIGTVGGNALKCNKSAAIPPQDHRISVAAVNHGHSQVDVALHGEGHYIPRSWGGHRKGLCVIQQLQGVVPSVNHGGWCGDGQVDGAVDAERLEAARACDSSNRLRSVKCLGLVVPAVHLSDGGATANGQKVGSPRFKMLDIHGTYCGNNAPIWNQGAERRSPAAGTGWLAPADPCCSAGGGVVQWWPAALGCPAEAAG
eukprot:m.168482 g.168482  ORF g.168482 m.168482 type:complete len:315 (+) comp21164_c0_seq1:266-1210(+)